MRFHFLSLVVVLSATACGTSSSAPDGGANDSGTDVTTTDASDDAGAAPITGAPDDQWTWVDFPNALCANGTPTGIAINPHAGATSLMIYFEGGGSCHDATTCWGVTPTATHLTGFDETTFAGEVTGNKLVPILLRQAAGNPFANMNLVYIPYCTGDLHSGTTLASLAESDGGTVPTYFYGALDMDAFLARLVPTFPSMSRVWVVGSSAGGFGTYLNFGRVVSAFGIGVDLIDDSGPPLVQNGSPTMNNAALFGLWGTAAGLPAGCSTCNSFRQVLDYDLGVQQTFSPPGRFGFLSFLEDTTIGPDFGYDPMTEYPGVMQTFSASLPDSGVAATFLVGNNPAHVVESDSALAPYYFPWMSAMMDRDAGWTDETHDGGT